MLSCPRVCRRCGRAAFGSLPAETGWGMSTVRGTERGMPFGGAAKGDRGCNLPACPLPSWCGPKGANAAAELRSVWRVWEEGGLEIWEVSSHGLGQSAVRGWWHSRELLQTRRSPLCLARSRAHLTPCFLPPLPVQATMPRKQWGRSSLWSTRGKGTSRPLPWGRGSSASAEGRAQWVGRSLRRVGRCLQQQLQQTMPSR